MTAEEAFQKVLSNVSGSMPTGERTAKKKKSP